MSPNTDTHNTQTPAEPTAAITGKFLTFILDTEEYGLDILQVQEIIPLQAITRMPGAPGYIRGVINLRGRIIPVMTLRDRFGLPNHNDTDKTCIIIAEAVRRGSPVSMGIVVDEVREVIDVSAGTVEAAPSFGAGIDVACLLGIAKREPTVTMLLDVQRILAPEELAIAAETTAVPAATAVE